MTHQPELTFNGFHPQKLIDFETDIANEFNTAKIRAPVHLYHGNEKEIIKVFNDKKITTNDWVLSSWRSHYQCLLKGVPPEELKQAIVDGRSISLCFEKQKIFCSAIVTGILPISVGLAMSNKMAGNNSRVFCFIGDMTSETGAAHECIKYSRNHNLPIHFIIEDNGKSVCTDTKKTWNVDKISLADINDEYITYYSYPMERYPHAGSGARIQF